MQRVGTHKNIARKQTVVKLANECLKWVGAQIVPAEVAMELAPTERHTSIGVTEDDRRFLVPNNPELVDLVRRYAHATRHLGPATIWDANAVSQEDLLFFRGDNAYVFQHRERNGRERTLLTYFYLDAIDHLGLLARLREDGDYGVFSFPTGDSSGALVSRDLLDSVNEILFLDRMLSLSKRSSFNMLDIGAGYGRLAHRMTTALPGIARYYCTDAVAQSTFLSTYYLRRKSCDKAIVVPFDRQEILQGGGTIDLAVNIHSFSECSLTAVEYWVRRCADLAIENLFIVPDRHRRTNTPGEKQPLILTDGTPFDAVLAKNGYTLVHAEPKYTNPEIQRWGVSPAWYYLFHRRRSV
jgi:hypothetical protein